MASRLPLALGFAVAVLAACAAPASEDAAAADGALAVGRDWSAHPAIVEIDQATDVYAVSDVHGGYAELGALLQQNGLISGFDVDPAKASRARWTGKTAIFVVAGDMIDKGAESLGTIDLLRALEPQAARDGGRVVVTLGNHEAEFLADPRNDKATATTEDGGGIDRELAARGIDPAALASGTDTAGRGAWLRNLPFGVRVKKWFFSHGGNTDGDSIPKLSKRLENAVSGPKGFGAKDVVGGDSILEAQKWYSGHKASDYAKALGVKHLVFGHDPGALEHRGRIESAQDGLLVKIDVMMGLSHEKGSLVSGALLHARILPDAADQAEILDASGTETPLF